MPLTHKQKAMGVIWEHLTRAETEMSHTVSWQAKCAMDKLIYELKLVEKDLIKALDYKPNEFST